MNFAHYDTIEYKRAALYIRCSKEEQVKSGETIQAQQQILKEFAETHNLKIVDYYIDAGFTARKNFHKRKEFCRLIEDVEQDKIDIIIFTKLDRWFRNVADYYKVQEILDKHRVSWMTALERYETETSNGKFIVNIMLAIAEDETRRISERVKTVFEFKTQNGEAITQPPVGLKIENKRIVIDSESSGYVLDIFEHYEKYNSKSSTAQYISEKYNKTLSHVQISRYLNQELYKGVFHGIPDFCPALIEPERFDRIQLQSKRNVKQNNKKYYYIFSGLIICKHCNHKFSGGHSASKNNNYLLYHCSYRKNFRKCNNSIAINEIYIEDYLLSCIKIKIEEYIINYEMQQKQAKQDDTIKSSIKKEKNKIKKLRELYINDLIEQDEYKKEYLLYKENLEKLESQLFISSNTKSKDLSNLKSILNLDLENIYENLSKEQRRQFWQSIIKNLTIDKDKNIEIFFE